MACAYLCRATNYRITNRFIQTILTREPRDRIGTNTLLDMEWFSILYSGIFSTELSRPLIWRLLFGAGFNAVRAMRHTKQTLFSIQ